MPEKADQEQLANITEMLRVMTYSRGWQGVDGPPDPDSKPFATWDGVVAHWRGDARREEMKNYKPPVENEKVLDKPQDAVKGSSSTAGGDTEEGESEDEGDLQENVVEVQEVENAEVLPPEEVCVRVKFTAEKAVWAKSIELKLDPIYIYTRSMYH